MIVISLFVWFDFLLVYCFNFLYCNGCLFIGEFGYMLFWFGIVLVVFCFLCIIYWFCVGVYFLYWFVNGFVVFCRGGGFEWLPKCRPLKRPRGPNRLGLGFNHGGHMRCDIVTTVGNTCKAWWRMLRKEIGQRHCYDGGNTGKAWWRMSRKETASLIQCVKTSQVAQDGCFSEDGNGNGSGKKVFVFGLGFTTLELATALQRQGWQVSGTCRSEEKRVALELRGLKAHLFDSEGEVECLEGEAMQDLLSSSHLVSSIPPGGFSCADPVLANLKNEVLQSHALRWIGYLSSTSVYGDWQGDWVSEDTEPQPVERRAISRWEAEKEWLQFGHEAGICTRVFRLGGIYGPGRSALDTILRGEKLSDRQQRRGRKRFTARIHVAYICQVIIKAMAMSQGEWPTRVYNVVDDDPTPRADVMAYAHTLL